MTKHSGLGHKLWKAFVLQAGLIGLTAILSIFAARFVLSDILISRAMNNEAEHFWEHYSQDPSFPRPYSFNMMGYLSGVDDIPPGMQKMSPGIHKMTKDAVDVHIVHVSERNGKRLYLEFDGERVGEMALLFGTIPLIGVLTIIYITTWLLYRFSRRAVSPIIRLSKEVDRLDPKNTVHFDINLYETDNSVDREVMILSRALSDLLKRIEAFVIRERNFTRDASHELRSPITVIKIAADMLLSDERLNESATKTVQRIRRSARDMEELIEALLLLAREADNKLSSDKVKINDILAEEIEHARVLYRHKNISVNVNEFVYLVVYASDKVLSVLIGNLLRNAFSYTDEGKVDITIDDHRIVIDDSGIGISDEQMKQVFKPFFSHEGKQRGGHGVGLTIVKLLSDRFKWPVTIDSELDVGTRVTVTFPDAISEKTTPHGVRVDHPAHRKS